MAQDLRKLFSQDQEQQKLSMPTGHEQRFRERLDEELPQNKPWYRSPWAVAASIVVAVGVASFFLLKEAATDQIPTTVVDREEATGLPQITLGDLSPDLKKVEDYYVSNINLELAQLDLSGEAKSVADGFITQLGALDAEYKRLNNELNTLGPNDQTIEALVRNLQLRLQLLYKLKETLEEYKSSENEQHETHQI